MYSSPKSSWSWLLQTHELAIVAKNAFVDVNATKHLLPENVASHWCDWMITREDKEDREGIPHTHPIPWVIRLELFLESG